LLSLMNDPILRNQMGKEGRKRCEKEFSLEHSVLLTTSLYNEIISNKLDKNG
jgi:glycosyltransferase involved in cell wall biosynthesis